MRGVVRKKDAVEHTMPPERSERSSVSTPAIVKFMDILQALIDNLQQTTEQKNGITKNHWENEILHRGYVTT